MLKLNEVVEALCERLNDEESEVAEAAASALVTIGDVAIPQLVEALGEAPSLHRGAILRVLSELQMPESEILGPVRKEMEAAYGLVVKQVTLESLQESSGRDYLLEALQADIDGVVRSILRLLRAVGLGREIELIQKGLLSQDKRTMAVAVEGMEKVVHKDLGRLLVPLVEEVPLRERFATGSKAFGVTPPSFEQLIDRYLDSGDVVRQIGASALLEELGEAHRWSETLELLLREGPPAVASQIRFHQTSGEGAYQVLTTLEKVLFLRKVDLFKDLDVRALTAIASIAEERLVEEGEVLCSEGDVGDSMFCIVDGLIRVLKRRHDGTALELAVVGPPEVLGEMALFEDKPRSASLKASEKTTVLVISGGAFLEIMHEYPMVGVSASRILSRRLREAGHRDSLLRAGQTSIERRSHPRIDSSLTATVEGDRQVTLRNLSDGGAYLLDEQPAKPWQRLSLTIDIPGHGPIAVEGIVRRCEIEPEGGGFGIAVGFGPLPEESAEALRSWVESRYKEES
jgi:CRP/FNR family transcriptional regulator